MSKLFKSKFFLSALVVSVMFVGVVAVKTAAAQTTTTTTTVSTTTAATTITHTLRIGSPYHSEVKLLQTALGITADGVFGPKTAAAVKVWQAKEGLTADGVFGPKSIAAWSGSMTMTSLPAGCTTSAGFSSTTGASCATGTTTMTSLPAGCTTASGYSPTTGASCATGVTTTVSASGPLTVSLASDNPAAGNLIQGQATADMAHFLFTGTGTLSQLTLQRTGISDNSVFPNVYLYNGNTRLTDSASINSLGQIIFNGLNIAVNGSLDISVKADIVSSANSVAESTAQVTLTGYEVSGSTAPTTVNIAGNVFVINSGTGVLSTVTVGTNTAAGGPSGSVSVSAGTQQLALWSAPINVSLHSVWLKTASFDVIGSAPSNALANIGLFANGVQIGTSTGINSMGYITFDLSAAPYSLITGATTLEVRADIVNGSSRTIQLSLQHASDLMVTDSQVGVNVAVTNQGSSTTYSINQGGMINILQGTLVAQSDPVFNSQTNVTGGATNVAIASYKLTSYGEDVKVNTVTVTPTITPSTVAACQTPASTTGLENVTLYYNGAPVGSSQNATLASNCTFNTLTFTPGSNLTISGGTTGLFQVHADLINGAGTPQYSTGSIGANVTITQYQGITSGQTGTLSLSGSNTQTIQTGSLTVAANSAFLSQTINPNTSGAQIGSFTLQNQSTSEGVDINSLAVGLCSAVANGTCTATTNPPLTDFSTLTLSSPSGSIGSITPIGQPTASNTFSTNFTIPAGGSVIINVSANVGATNGATFLTSLLPTAVGHSSRVTITSTAVGGQSITLGVGTVSTPTLITSQSTNSQYISTAGSGAVNAAQETYNFVATTGTANIIGLKFAALTGVSKAYTSGGTFTTTGSTGSFVVASGDVFNVGDNVLITTTGVYGGTNAVGTVTAHSSGALTVNLTTPIVLGYTNSGLTTPGVVSTVYQLATSGVTGVALNSPGVATGSATFNGGIAYLSAITGASGTGAAVPNSPSGVTLPVFMSFGPVNTNGGVASGSTGQIILEYVQYQTGSNTSYLAPSVAGTSLTLVGSKPNITLASSGTTPTAPTTDLLLGTITIAADNTGDIYVHQIPVNVSINSGTSPANAAISSVKLTDTNDVTLTGLGQSGTCSAASNGSTSGCLQTFSNGNYYRVSAGQSKTFEVHATTTGSFGTSASVSFGMGASNTFLWGDVNGGANAGTTGVAGATDLQGVSLYSYPNASVSIHN